MMVIIILAHQNSIELLVHYKMIEQKGMTFDHEFVYYFPLFSFLLKKVGRRKGE